MDLELETMEEGFARVVFQESLNAGLVPTVDS